MTFCLSERQVTMKTRSYCSSLNFGPATPTCLPGASVGSISQMICTALESSLAGFESQAFLWILCLNLPAFSQAFRVSHSAYAA